MRLFVKCLVTSAQGRRTQILRHQKFELESTERTENGEVNLCCLCCLLFKIVRVGFGILKSLRGFPHAHKAAETENTGGRLSAKRYHESPSSLDAKTFPVLVPK
jgi:hypothetical protein